MWSLSQEQKHTTEHATRAVHPVVNRNTRRASRPDPERSSCREEPQCGHLAHREPVNRPTDKNDGRARIFRRQPSSKAVVHQSTFLGQ